MKKITRELAGQKFGEWTVIERAPDQFSNSGRKIKHWSCRCGGCGKLYNVNEQSLIGLKSAICRKCFLKRKPNW